MKKIIKLVSKFLTPQQIANLIKDKLQKLEYAPLKKNNKFLDKLFSFEVKNTLDDINELYNDLFRRFNR